jgi:hypothetical protein
VEYRRHGQFSELQEPDPAARAELNSSRKTWVCPKDPRHPHIT